MCVFFLNACVFPAIHLSANEAYDGSSLTVLGIDRHPMLDRCRISRYQQTRLCWLGEKTEDEFTYPGPFASAASALLVAVFAPIPLIGRTLRA